MKGKSRKERKVVRFRTSPEESVVGVGFGILR